MTVISAEPTARDRKASLTAAVQKYFDLMYDCDTSRLYEVFRSTAHLHGFRDGRMMSWPMEVYKDILDKRQSPKSLGAPRAEEILQMDFASADMAFVKLRPDRRDGVRGLPDLASHRRQMADHLEGFLSSARQ